ncbi:Microcystin-dependent protein [Rhizobiales bacterium GAS191]|jgi:microcystin-dependent protein|nr:Microcystin-dependent protein [Rhizobiales bacterium GAS191]
MSAPFVAEIRIFGFNFAPKGWAMCNGQLLQISQNTALFSLLGTTYGGDGKSTFGLPNLQGSVPIHVGGNQPGPGLSIYDLGEVGGSSNVTLLTSEMPSHSHSLNADTGNANSASPANAVYKSGQYPGNPAGAVWLYTSAAPATSLSATALSTAGSSFPHNNMMPTLTLNFCIAMQGIFPARP